MGGMENIALINILRMDRKFKQADKLLACWHDGTANNYSAEQLADKFIEDMKNEGLNPDQMIEVLQLAKEKYEYLVQKFNPVQKNK